VSYSTSITADQHFFEQSSVYIPNKERKGRKAVIYTQPLTVAASASAGQSESVTTVADIGLRPEYGL